MAPFISRTRTRTTMLSALQQSLLVTIIILTFAAGCRKVDTPTTPPDVTPSITTAVAGQITDESGLPLAGVTVTNAGGTATTDANGLFVIPDAALSNGRTVVIAKKAGYFNGARAAMATIGKVTYMKLSLAMNAILGTVNATTGGTVNLPSGASLMLSPSGVVTASGAAYSGLVSVSAKHLDPANTNFNSLFAGDLVAQQADGSQTILTSAGVVIAELHGASGEILQPAPGKPALLTIPITPSQRATATSTIPLWYFDETLGMWKEEGVATKFGNSYSANVQHFSAWNYDWKGPWGTIHGRIVCSGVPLPGISVNVGTSGTQPITDGSGEFTVKVPAETNNIEIQVLANQNGGIYYMNAPKPVAVPRDVTTELGDFTLDSPCPSYMSGNLQDCNKTGVPGMIVASWTGGMSYVYTKDGAFSMVAAANQMITLTGTAKSGVAIQPQTAMTGTMGGQVSVDLSTCVDQSSNVQIDISGSYDGKALAFSPDGSKLAVLSSDDKDVVILDTKTGTKLAQLAGAFTGSYFDSTGGNYVSFSPDGSKLLTFRGYQFDVWSTTGAKLTTQSVYSTYGGAVFSPDGAGVIYYVYDSSVTPNQEGVFEYDIASGKNTKSFSVPGSYSGVFPTDGSNGHFAVVTTDVSNTTTCYIWDAATDKAVTSFPISLTQSHWYYNYPASRLSADGKVLSIVVYGMMHFFNTQTGTEISTSNISLPYGGSYDLSGDDATYIGQFRAGPGNTVGLFGLVDGQPKHTFTAPIPPSQSTGVTISPDGKFAAAVYANVVRIWKTQ